MKKADLPRELARIREYDYELHMKRLREAGLTEAEARKHARSELRERDMLERAELRAPSMPPAKDVPDRSGKRGKARKAKS